MRRRVVAYAVLVAAALLAWSTALAGALLYDDVHSVAENPALRSLAEVPSFLWRLDAFSALPQARMYRPVLLASLAWNHVVGGGAVWVFKLTDVLIHAWNACLVFSLARCLRAPWRPAFAVALLFAVHPLASEAVNFVSARSDQLLATGTLLAMRCWFGAVHGRRSAWLGIAAATAIACGSKETGVMVPACLCVLEWLHARRRGLEPRAVVRRLAPAVAVAAGYLVARRLLFGVATVAAPRIVSSGSDVLTGADRGLVTQFALMGTQIPKLLAQSVAPVGLCIDPELPWHLGPTSPWVLAGWLCLAVLTVAGLSVGRRRPAVFVGTCAAWLVALPWIVVPLNFPVLEHRFYGSLAALALVAAGILPDRVFRARTGRAGLAAVTLVAALLAAGRSRAWHDGESLWLSTLRGNPSSVQAMLALAELDARAAQADPERASRARRFAERAAAHAPENRLVRRRAARVHLDLGPAAGEPLLAVVHAEALVAEAPRNPFHRLLLSHAFVQAAQRSAIERFYDDAEAAALAVLEIAEPKGRVFRVAAEARAARGDVEGAVALLDESVARGLDHWSVLLQRAEYLVQLERREGARADLRRVLVAEPFEPRARYLWALLERTP